MNTEQWTQARPLIIDSCTELFANSGLSACPCGEFAERRMSVEGIAAFVGITGQQVRGGVGLALPLALVEWTHPMGSAQQLGPRQLRDWASELGNQLAGRIKTKFLSHGVTFRLSSPMAVIGKDLHMPDDHPERGHRIIEFVCRGLSLYVDFSAELSEGVILAPIEESQEDHVKEGEIVLF